MSDNPETIEALIRLNADLLPLIEGAEGFRATLISRGWPAEDAQQCATLLMLKFVSSIFDDDSDDEDDE